MEMLLVKALQWCVSWMVCLVCLIIGHDWDFSYLRNLDGSLYRFACCTRCEKSVEQEKEPEEYAELVRRQRNARRICK